jgi:hypothetical protein
MRYQAFCPEYAICCADSYLFQFGLEAPLAFSEIREIVAEELGKCSATSRSQAPNSVELAGKTLLPRMRLPAHLRDRERHELRLGVVGG